jgi:transcriptional regulator with XRE-family HTH domain
LSFAKRRLGLPKILGLLLGMANWPAGNCLRLAAAIRKRRTDLGLTQLDIHHAGGPSNSTLTALESGAQQSINNPTLNKLDTALSWTPGTALAILRGEAEDVADLTEVPIDHLLSEIRRRVVQAPSATEFGRRTPMPPLGDKSKRRATGPI